MAELSAKGPLISSLYFQEAREVAGRLHLSRAVVIPVAVFLAMARGMTWFWTKPPDPPTASATNVLVTQRSGSVVCGKLASEKGVLLTKNKQAGTLTVLNDVAAINVVSACP